MPLYGCLIGRPQGQDHRLSVLYSLSNMPQTAGIYFIMPDMPWRNMTQHASCLTCSSYPHASTRLNLSQHHDLGCQNVPRHINMLSVLTCPSNMHRHSPAWISMPLNNMFQLHRAATCSNMFHQMSQHALTPRRVLPLAACKTQLANTKESTGSSDASQNSSCALSV